MFLGDNAVMKASIQTKFLIVCSVLVLLTIAGLSVTYYSLISRIMHRESRRLISVAFDIVLSDLENRMNTFVNRVTDFLVNDILGITTFSYTQDPQRIQSISFISTNLARAADELKRFGSVNSVRQLMLYGADKRLLIIYQQGEEHESTGIYVVLQDGKDAYLPVDDPSRLTPMLLGREPIPNPALPEGIAAYYAAEIPNTPSVKLFTQNTTLGIRTIAPIVYQEQITGVLVVEITYTQSLAEQYASLSNTAVNLFAGNQLSIGTLPAQSHLDPATLAHMVSCKDIPNQSEAIEIRSMTFNGQDHYQGQCALKDEQGTVGAITISLSEEAEEQEIRRLQIAVLIISGIMLGLTFGLSLMLSRKSTRSVQNLVTVIGDLAEGDLRKTVVALTQDEFGILTLNVNQMIERLRAIVGQVQRSGMQVTSSSTELAATAKQQEVIMSNQVDSTNKVLRSVQEISNVVTELVQTMQEVAAMSQETAGFASSGQKDLARMQEAMQHMEEASSTISGRLQTIHEKADNITSVVTTITKVADQTNLLSLNAAIEAEKAGEYGRGFTVVAREIRRLADQTAVATLDIEQMVQEMQSAVSAGVMEMDKFIQDVQHSAEDVERISLQLTRIIEQVQALSPRFEEVNVAMGRQSDHAHEINTAMTNLSEEMRQTTESLKESFFAIGQLNEAARGLQEEMSRFKVS
jgi:methyl-accepting chemotaxis protein